MTNKEKNFISAVVYLHDCEAQVRPFFEALTAQLNAHFDQYELVAVDDACTDGTVEALREFAQTLTKPLTVLHMSLRQGVELGMNAGQDCAIGDFVYEFDSAVMHYPPEMIWQAYETALAGNDIVSVCPSRSRGASRMFYRVFNAFSRSKAPLRSEAFRLLSRRGINRVHAISEDLPYRKAAYAASGLAMASLTYEGDAPSLQGGRVSLALDSLALYTDAAFRLSAGVALAMLALTVAELIYTLCVFLGGGHPIEGWTTTMFVLTVGFGGVFAILAIVLKYLSLLVDLVFKKQKYLLENIEKL